MKVLVLNSGSSSIKYQLWESEGEHRLARGIVSRIGEDDGELEHIPEGRLAYRRKFGKRIDHTEALKAILDILVSQPQGVIKSVDEIKAVGHRVVHGGEKFIDTALITDEVIEKIRECIPLAPLHNPPNLKGIEVCRSLLPLVPQTAVFDTTFHKDIPPYAFIYGLPYHYYEKYGIRRYGFHGTSHMYVAHKGAELLGRDIGELKIITCHLGNGASITAVQSGKSVDTSMGFTPAEGLLMGTRAGDMDPAVPLFIMNKTGINIIDMDNIINKRSGLLGVSGVSNDMRDIISSMEKGNERAKLAFDIYCYRVKKYIGAYAAALGGVDLIVFTAGIGENNPLVREHCCRNLEFLGVEIDPQLNAEMVGKNGLISKPTSRVKVAVIRTNEELVIVKETLRILKESNLI